MFRDNLLERLDSYHTPLYKCILKYKIIEISEIKFLLQNSETPNDIIYLARYTTTMKTILRLYREEYNKNRGIFKRSQANDNITKISDIIILFLEYGGDYKGYEHYPVIREFFARKQKIVSEVERNITHESANLAQIVIIAREASSRVGEANDMGYL
jgi:hypothetical protein